MQYLQTLFFYSFSSSALLIYGIGLEKSFLGSRPGAFFFARFPGVMIEMLLSVFSLWGVYSVLLLPAGMFYMVPLMTVLICGIIHIMIALVFPFFRTTDSGERLFYLGLVFLSVSEGTSLADSLCIAAAGILSFFITTVILLAIRERTSSSRVYPDIKGSPLILITMGLLFTILYAADISWWLQEGVK